MKKTQSLIVFIVAVAVVITVVEVAGYLMFADSAPVSGSMTITDEVGDTTSPEQPFTDISEVTVERNETGLAITIKVGGEIPKQSDERIGYSFGAPTLQRDRINDLIRLDLHDNEWIPKLGYKVWPSYLHMDHWYAESYCEDFPGSFTIDHDIIRIYLDSDYRGEKDFLKYVRYGAFSWYVHSGTGLPHKPWDGYRNEITWDTTMTSHFPDYGSFISQSEQSSFRESTNTFYFRFLAPIFVGGVIVWGIGVHALSNPPKQVKTLGAIFSSHGILLLVAAINLLYQIPSQLPAPYPSFMGIFAILAFLFFFVCVAFFLVARGILRGKRLTRKFGLVLSTLTAVFSFLLFSMVVRAEIEWMSSPYYYTDWLGIFMLSALFFLWATSVLCIYSLTRPKVKDFLARD